jgi:hypothetical protein
MVPWRRDSNNSMEKTSCGGGHGIEGQFSQFDIRSHFKIESRVNSAISRREPTEKVRPPGPGSGWIASS